MAAESVNLGHSLLLSSGQTFALHRHHLAHRSELLPLLHDRSLRGLNVADEHVHAFLQDEKGEEECQVSSTVDAIKPSHRVVKRQWQPRSHSYLEKGLTSFKANVSIVTSTNIHSDLLDILNSAGNV